MTEISATISEKSKNIKMLVLDVDGVLTDGTVSYTDSGSETKSFNIKDGLGIKLLQKVGIAVGVITGRISPMVERRAKELGICPLIQGREDKGDALRSVAQTSKLSLDQIAYMGDDLPDLSALEIAGLSLAPIDAHLEIRNIADWTSSLGGGKGAVREACDLLLQAKGSYADATKHFRSDT